MAVWGGLTNSCERREAKSKGEEWYGEGGGRRIQDGEHMYTCGGKIKLN